MSSTREAPTDARHRLREWFSSMPGRLILDAEVELLGEILPNLFGYYLLQVGRLSPVDMLSRTRVLQSVVLDIDEDLGECDYPRLYGTAHALPIASDSVDVILLPHVLEFETHAHEALRESQRVLVPEGSLVLSGFNPWSIMGLSRILLRRRETVPWRGQFLSLNRIKDWLALLGFDVTGVRTFFFRPPLASESLLARLKPLEVAGARAWPYFAGCYLVVARKKVISLTPIRPRWERREKLGQVGLAEPSARAGGHE